MFARFLTVLLYTFIAMLLACIPALPFWIFEYNLAGCIVWLILLPISIVTAVSILNYIFKQDKGDDNNGDEKPSKPKPPTSKLRWPEWVSKN